MDQTSIKKLQEITSYEPAALTESDKAFLKARRAYLSEDQKVVYAEVLGDEPTATAGAKGPSLNELKVRGALVGVVYKVGMKKVDFQKAIEDAEAGSPDTTTDKQTLEDEAATAAANGETSENTSDEEV